ncbi:MAG: hypothetical protein JW878_02850 [Methanomicrobia archaeon]|nr:hypothetical protein [Methanomicrobia archaeon]
MGKKFRNAGVAQVMLYTDIAANMTTISNGIARAVESVLFVLKANAAVSANGTISCGDSILVDQNGVVIQEADHRTETILSCKLD